MEILAPPARILVTAALIIGTASGVWSIKCYECSEQPVQIHPNKTIKLCAQFQESEDFEVDCQYSTFCRKLSVQLALPTGELVTSVRRDCAPQFHSYRKLVNNKWVSTNETEHNIYNAGCYEEDVAGARATVSEYCYCKKHLCNSAKGSHEGSYTHHTDAMAVIFVFNAVKFIGSLR